jgi:hypothetical protein
MLTAPGRITKGRSDRGIAPAAWPKGRTSVLAELWKRRSGGLAPENALPPSQSPGLRHLAAHSGQLDLPLRKCRPKCPPWADRF